MKRITHGMRNSTVATAWTRAKRPAAQLADDRRAEDDDGIDRAADDAAERQHGECLYADLAHRLDLVCK